MAYLGLALVIANDYKDYGDHDRVVNASTRRPHLPGTHEDSKDYYETFEKYLKYKVTLRHNLTGNGICRATDDLISEAMHCPFVHVDACIAFVFCGHGEDGVIIGQDGVKVSLDEIFKRFKTRKENSHLAPLAKLFFIDACRGENEDRGVLIARGGEVILERLVPCEGNMLITYSTLPQFQAYEVTCHPPRGLFSGHFNQELRNDNNTDLTWDDIITIATEQMEKESRKSATDVRFQTPQKVGSLRCRRKPLKEAREFQPRPIPAPRRKMTAPGQCSVPPQGKAEEVPPSLQVQQHQMALAGSMHALQPPSVAYQPPGSVSGSQSKFIHFTACDCFNFTFMTSL